MLKEILIGVIVLVIGWFVISGGDTSGIQKLISTGTYQTEKISQNIKENLPKQETEDIETKTELTSSEEICPSFSKELISVTIKSRAESRVWEGDLRSLTTPYGKISEAYQVSGDSVEEVKDWFMGEVGYVGSNIEDSSFVLCRTNAGVSYQCGRGSNVGQDTSLFYCSGSPTTGQLFFQKTDTEYDGTVIKDITTTSILVESFVFNPDTYEITEITCKDISAFCK